MLADGALVSLVFLIHDVHGPLPSEELAVAAVAGWHDAVKKINAPADRLNDVAGVPTPIR